MNADDPSRNEMFYVIRRLCEHDESLDELVVGHTWGGERARRYNTLLIIFMGVFVASVAAVSLFVNTFTVGLLLVSMLLWLIPILPQIRSNKTQVIAVTDRRMLLVDFGTIDHRRVQVLRQLPLATQLPKPAPGQSSCSVDFGETLYIRRNEFGNLERARQAISCHLGA